MTGIKRVNRMVVLVILGIAIMCGTSSGCDEEFFFDDYGAFADYGYHDGYDFITQGLGYSGYDEWANDSISTFAGSFVSYD